ncbi:hypothetical protein WJX72_011030 [[Myrmecia] bisecta]|uniref:Thiol-disulfide oxidoreductase DCC n=1 Tax=[Myrmecia] bisecta TaxID=41462 RepID=A0AAW1PD61_9CHLO
MKLYSSPTQLTSCTKTNQLLQAVSTWQAHKLRSKQSILYSQAQTQATTSRATQRDYFATDRRPVVLFDGVCNICNGGVDSLLKFDKEGKHRMAALQSTPGKQLLQQSGRAPDDISSIVLVEEGRHYVKSDAILRIGRSLNPAFFVLANAALAVPKVIRDTVYDQVANNRYNLLGKRDTCRLADDAFRERFIEE